MNEFISLRNDYNKGIFIGWHNFISKEKTLFPIYLALIS